MTSISKALDQIFFVDIETSAIKRSYQELAPRLQNLWSIKGNQINKYSPAEKSVEELYLNKAGIFAEFAKVICISIGYFDIEKKRIKSFRAKSIYGEDEVQVLKSFNRIVKKHFNKPKSQFICGHNIKEFDIPFLCRRMIIQNIKIPRILDLKNKKPWEVKQLIDTLHLWRFGDYKHYTSLDLLAAVLELPSPKEEVDGSQIHDLYWNKKDFSSIFNYCERDVFTTAKVYLRLMQIDFPEDLVLVSKTRLKTNLD